MLLFVFGDSFAPSGMLKSGTYAIPTTYTPITGWTPDPAYPGSTTSGTDALVAQGANVAATAQGAAVFSSGFNITVTARITVNGVVVATGTPVSGTSGTASVPATAVAIANGDLVRLEIVASSGAGTPTVQVAGTFLRIT